MFHISTDKNADYRLHGQSSLVILTQGIFPPGFTPQELREKGYLLTHNMPHFSSLFGYHTAIQFHTFTLGIAGKDGTEILFKAYNATISTQIPFELML